MSDEQLRIAVAEAMGEIRVLNKKDYPNSRDACASFEATLDSEQVWTYCGHLFEVTARKITGSAIPQVEPSYSIMATARQRCLAYLATVAPAKLK